MRGGIQMAVELPLFKIPGKVASGDLSSDQFKFVSLDSNGEVQVATDTDVIIGVLQNAPDAQGKTCEIMVAGISKVQIGATGFDAGDAVMCDDTGGAALEDDGTAGQKVGYAFNDCTADAVGSIVINCLAGPTADAT